MRAAKAVFVIGIIFLVLSVVIAAIGASGEKWQQKEKPYVEEVLTVYGGTNGFPFPKLVYLPEGSKDIIVRGTVRELRSQNFDLYVLNKRNYELWVAKASYNAFVEVKSISSHSLSFSPTREDVMNALFFVVVNARPFSGPTVSVEFSIKISWSERSYAPALGGLVLGTILGGLGLLLVIVSAVMKFVFGRNRRNEMKLSPAKQAAAGRFCTSCGAAIPVDVKFCNRCGSPVS